MSTTTASMIDSDHHRLQRYVAAWAARLAREEDQLEDLRRRLQSVGVVDAAKAPPTLVTLHSVIRARELDSGRAFVWTVFLPTDEEVDTTARSPLSSAGAVLLGAQSGDEVLWPSRAGTLRVRIEAVLSRPEEARHLSKVVRAVTGKDTERGSREARRRKRTVVGAKQNSPRQVVDHTRQSTRRSDERAAQR